MKTCLLLLCVAQTSALTFEIWAARYQKPYTADNIAHRRSVFAANMAKVAELNAADSSASYSLDTPWADLTADEFAREKLTPARKPVSMDAAQRYMPSPIASDLSSQTAAPTSFDWRDHGAVSSVKDQGTLGTCWAFSAIGNIEGQLALKEHAAPIDLSVEQLIECDNTSDPKNKTGDCGEFGGWPYMAFQYFKKAGGVFKDEDMPYCAAVPMGKPGGCLPCMARGYDKKVCGSYDDDDQIPLYCNTSTTRGQGPANLCGAGAAKVGFTAGSQVADWKWFSFDEDQIASALAGGSGNDGGFAGGPLSVALNAQLLQFYKKGVFNPKLPCSAAKLDHGVLIVGFGTDAAAGPYWIVKNSWGPSWGEDGYFRIARGSGKCGINTQVTTALLA